MVQYKVAYRSILEEKGSTKKMSSEDADLDLEYETLNEWTIGKLKVHTLNEILGLINFDRPVGEWNGTERGPTKTFGSYSHDSAISFFDIAGPELCFSDGDPDTQIFMFLHLVRDETLPTDIQEWISLAYALCSVHVIVNHKNYRGWAGAIQAIRDAYIKEVRAHPTSTLRVASFNCRLDEIKIDTVCDERTPAGDIIVHLGAFLTRVVLHRVGLDGLGHGKFPKKQHHALLRRFQSLWESIVARNRESLERHRLTMIHVPGWHDIHPGVLAQAIPNGEGVVRCFSCFKITCGGCTSPPPELDMPPSVIKCHSCSNPSCEGCARGGGGSSDDEPS
jgi:hypothetical protein